ncbi:MAG: hypothetical protein NTU85_02000 [Candidatus Kaiserbacteria bacterium]|nr:hypothetical protein [Candidatus Kaiserbacteria bacterium]
MSTSTLKKDGQGEVIHTLLTREIRPIRNWYEWLLLWAKTETIEEMLGLLHVGFNVSLEKETPGELEYDEVDRIIFYFTMADGWADGPSLRLPNDGNKEYRTGFDLNGWVIKKRPFELRQQLAKKAFDMLCMNFFKTELRDDRAGSSPEFQTEWEKIVTSKRLFPIIQKFFEVKDLPVNGMVKIRNFSERNEKRSHNEQLVVKFLLNLTEFVWEWKEDEIPWFTPDKEKERVENQNVEMHSRLNSSKPWMTEVLIGLDEIDTLARWMIKIDENCLSKLRVIAFSTELRKFKKHPVKRDRRVATLEEACFAGTPAAIFLKTRELVMREHTRLTKILKAEQVLEKASRKVEELTAKQQ